METRHGVEPWQEAEVDQGAEPGKEVEPVLEMGPGQGVELKQGLEPVLAVVCWSSGSEEVDKCSMIAGASGSGGDGVAPPTGAEPARCSVSICLT